MTQDHNKDLSSCSEYKISTKKKELKLDFFLSKIRLNENNVEIK
jgi:hypothetical protein